MKKYRVVEKKWFNDYGEPDREWFEVQRKWLFWWLGCPSFDDTTKHNTSKEAVEAMEKLRRDRPQRKTVITAICTGDSEHEHWKV